MHQNLFLDMIRQSTSEHYSFYRPGDWVPAGLSNYIIRLSSIINKKWDVLPEQTAPTIFTRGDLSFSVTTHLDKDIHTDILSFPFVARSLTRPLDAFIFGTDLLIHPVLEVTISALTYDSLNDSKTNKRFKDFIHHLYYLHPVEINGSTSDYFLGLIKKHEQLTNKV